MGEIVIHGLIGSPFVRSPMVALAEKGEGCRLRPVKLDAIRAPDFAALHPFHRVPVFEHDGFVLYETQAILRHIERTWPEPAMIPSDPIAAARMNQALGVIDNYLFPEAGEVLGFNRILAPRFLKLEPDEAACARAATKLARALAVLAKMLGDKPWLVGPEMSLADIALGCHLEFLHPIPEGGRAIAAEPLLEAFRTRMGERQSFRDTTIPELARRFLPPKRTAS